MSASDPLIALADQCVLCGLCLPVCPTYALDPQEGESPRGRITLIRGLAEARLEPTPVLVQHLDQCLVCRRCEAVCPANVRYGELIAGARALPALRRKRAFWRRRLPLWLAHPGRVRALLALRPLLALLRPWWRRGQGAWAQRVRLVAGLPGTRSTAADAVSAPGAAGPEGAGTVEASTTMLLRGCVGEAYEAGVRQHATSLLAACGENVRELEPGLCCGSLARHGGEAGVARDQERALVGRLKATGVRTLLNCASGCQARLHEILADTGIQVRELHVHLADRLAAKAPSFAALPMRIAVHQACSQRLLGRASTQAILQLLDLIPGVERIELPAQDRCCGAAGSHFLEQPARAEALRAQVLDDIGSAAPELIVSTNLGCRLFLSGGLQARGRTIPILHPIELLAQQVLP